MDLVQRALTWEAREPDLYMNVFFGFPFADVPDVGMTVQAMSNGKPELARKAAEDVATFAWRRREALLKTATVHPIPEGVKLAREAVAHGAWPVVLADHSDRSGSATWILQQVITQDLADVLIAEYLTQVMDPLDLKLGPGFTIDQFKVFAIKSRVHFRRGFDDSGFAKTIVLVEPEQPFLGTVRLEALPYRNVDISKFYPYGDVSFPLAA